MLNKRGRGSKMAALLISENAAMLTELDTAIGDGDHGEKHDARLQGHREEAGDKRRLRQTWLHCSNLSA